MGATGTTFSAHVRQALLSILRVLPGDATPFNGLISEIAAGGPHMWNAFVAHASYHGVLGVIDSALAGSI